MIGQSLDRYNILEPLGEGGMAIVYKAYDTRLICEVAVKIIRTDKFTPEALDRALKRFELEAKALARLTHPNIVKVIDYGEYEGHPYLVMPLLAGGSLKRMLANRGRLSWQEAVRLLIPIAEALDYAHKQNIIHRDVKPGNILLTETGQPLLTDFGVAKVLDDDATVDLTGTNAAVGTPEYMAPEQVISKTVDQRADIYALGVVFYEMITGRRPFEADTPMAVLFKHASDPLPRPTKFVPLPDAVEKVLLKALEKKPEYRYQSMQEMAAALGHLLAIPHSFGNIWFPIRKLRYEINNLLSAIVKYRPIFAVLIGMILLVTFIIWVVRFDGIGMLPVSTHPLTPVDNGMVTSTSTSPTTETLSPANSVDATLAIPPTVLATKTIEMKSDQWNEILLVRMPTLNEIRAETPISVWDANMLTVRDLYQPGVDIYSGTVSLSQEYLFPVYWCATSANLLALNMENIETNFHINGEVVPNKYVFNYNYDTNSGWKCNYYAIVLGGWAKTTKYTLEIIRVFSKDLSDGKKSYLAGEYIYQLTVNVR